ncbi:MAG: formamidopyrimidine-DNA glycosylase [Actinomycetota bacterium]|nr:formamidopyrimidine-DNA glycosylase [Actinomycetota bacterium]
MPELPEMQALSERLAQVMVGQRFAGAQPIQFAGLKTYAPDPQSLVGQEITNVGRIGKYVVMTFDSGVRILLHLSQAGRLDVETPAKTTRPKQGVVRFLLEPGVQGGGPRSDGVQGGGPRGDRSGILVKEFGTERKAGWWVLAPGDDGPLERLGPEPGTPEFAELIRTNVEGRRIHTLLRDQRVVSGMGRGYTDDALWKAKLSPYATFKSLTADDRERLLESIDFVVADGLAAERKIESGYPTKKVKHWMVHNKHGEPCPVCADTLRRVSYESYEITYCPTCQTGGKILADRRLSRLLK